MKQPTSITQLLECAREGDQAAALELWNNVYEELRRIAQRAVNQEYGSQSMQATEIAHEAYLRLAANESFDFESRSHLLSTVARAIRRLLVDRARARKAEKRGGELQRVLLDDVLDTTAASMPDLLDLETALSELEILEPRYSKLVELRYFAGMSLDESARTLNVSTRTAANDWAFAKAWLKRRLGGSL